MIWLRRLFMPNKKKPDHDEDECQDVLADSICALNVVLREMLEQRQDEFDWLKAHSGLANKQDLLAMEQRLIEAIGKHAQITPAVVSAAERLGASLEALDATVPDKQT